MNALRRAWADLRQAWVEVTAHATERYREGVIGWPRWADFAPPALGEDETVRRCQEGAAINALPRLAWIPAALLLGMIAFAGYTATHL